MSLPSLFDDFGIEYHAVPPSPQSLVSPQIPRNLYPAGFSLRSEGRRVAFSGGFLSVHSLYEIGDDREIAEVLRELRSY